MGVMNGNSDDARNKGGVSGGLQASGVPEKSETVPGPVHVSVIICTYNRADSLRRTLQTCGRLVIPNGVGWEVVVVDNNSTDHTRQVCEELSGRIPIRRVFEREQGQSAARNRGIREALGRLLLFTDDDCEVDPSWLSAFWDAHARHPKTGFFGGKVLPLWDHEPPAWVRDNLRLIWVHVHEDRGESEITVTRSEDGVFPGANLALSRNVCDDTVQFNNDICLSGDDSSDVRGEDIVFQLALLSRNLTGLYVPKAVVYHHHPAYRSTEKYLRRYHAGLGVADVRLGRTSKVKPWFGVARIYWKYLVKWALVYFLTRWSAPSRIWLRAEIRMAETWGVISETRRRQAAARQRAATGL